MSWEDVDMEKAAWNIPGPHRKSVKGKKLPSLLIPLPRQAMAFLNSVEHERRQGLVFCNGAGNKLGNWDRWQKRMFAKTGTSGWHRHDLRRTISTAAGDLGVPPHVVEMMLGRTQPHTELAAIYNKSRYAPEHKDALQKLADYLEELEAGMPSTARLLTSDAPLSAQSGLNVG